jgi:hypothetical protein
MPTPDLIARTKLAVDCLTTHCDASRGRLPYFYTRMSAHPPTAHLALWSYGDGLGRSVDSLALIRHMHNESIDGEADRTMRDSLISLMGVDGLSWAPAEPWTMPVPHTRPAWFQAGTMMALTTLFLFTNDSQYRELAEKNIAAVTKLAKPMPGGYSEFPGDVWTRSAGWDAPPPGKDHQHSVFSTSGTMPLLRHFRRTGYEPALKLASSLIAWALEDHKGDVKIFDIGHFHCQSRLVTALLLRGIATNNDADMQLAEQLYLKAKSLGTESGWFPEQIHVDDSGRANLSETCCLTDMIEAAILLGQHRDVKFWSDAERFARNHLMAHQITTTEWMQQLTTPAPTFDKVINEAGPQVHEHLRGGFAGWGGVSAMSDDTTFANYNQHCCNAAGARGLYDVWRYAIDDDGKTFTVNLHIDRAHAAADVIANETDDMSHAQTIITLNQPRAVKVRIPEFVNATDIAVARSKGAPAAPPKDGYLSFDAADAGDTITLTWPLKPRTSLERIATGEFTFQWRGPNVASASPMQKVLPLFPIKPSPRTDLKDAPRRSVEIDSL